MRRRRFLLRIRIVAAVWLRWGIQDVQGFSDTQPTPLRPGRRRLPASRAAGTAKGLAKASHALGPAGSLYDELYFQYRQRMGSSPVSSLDQLRRFHRLTSSSIMPAIG